MDFANRQRYEFVSSELERSEQDSKKFPSSSGGQVDFLIAGQVTFKAQLPQESHPLTKTQRRARSGPWKVKCESYLPKGQAGIQVFLEPLP